MSQSELLPELSRSCKYEKHISSFKKESRTRKRKASPDESSSQQCFEIRNMPSKGGIGMFATRDIACGDLIIPHEDPIISCASATDVRNFCLGCYTPLGTIRAHLAHDIISAPAVLPCIGTDDDLNFQSGPGEPTACSYCDKIVWCSRPSCFKTTKLKHMLKSCCSKRLVSLHQSRRDLEEFLEELPTKHDVPPLLFRLAYHSMLLILSTRIEQLESKNVSSFDDDKISKVLWWNDYGSHPLWWQLGNAALDHKISKQQKDLADRFCHILVGQLDACASVVEFPGGQSSLSWMQRNILHGVDHLGRLLGMLQTNVMEFEFQTPAQQYVQHLRMMVEESGDDTTANDEANQSARWIEEHCTTIPDDDGSPIPTNKNQSQQKDTDGGDNVHRAICDEPMIGSGLYPLLTLANHSCDPNASIDFLQESNRGSMVALRKIKKGEEIAITYIPNGEWESSDDADAADSADRFRHFQPTRTWKWLNQNNGENHSDDDSAVGNELSVGDDSNGRGGDEMEDQESKRSEDDDDDDDGSGDSGGNEEDEYPEGQTLKDRVPALLEYGFSCTCKRCVEEEKEAQQHVYVSK